MGLNFQYISGQTPVDEDEALGLLIPSITWRSELDEFEQQNIEEAMLWIASKKMNAGTVFSDSFIKLLHQKMFGYVWKWAGEFRKSNKNIGVDKWQIPVAMKTLCDDALYWNEHSIYSPDEFAIRFKHRIVSIHCFVNGNGRYSRLLADIIIEKLFNLLVFTWGAGDLIHSGDIRTKYLRALNLADAGDFSALIEFARS
jgi:Fic-DOC domain mobile mystery protein B